MKRLIGVATALFMVGLVSATTHAAELQQAQSECSVDCGSYCCEAGSYCTGGGCCPDGTWDTGDGYCIPDGYPYCGSGKYCSPGDTIACGGRCYRDAREAAEAGCPVSEHIVCSSPVE